MSTHYLYQTNDPNFYLHRMPELRLFKFNVGGSNRRDQCTMFTIKDRDNQPWWSRYLSKDTGIDLEQAEMILEGLGLLAKQQKGSQ